LYDFELTDRGKIVLVLLIAGIILVVSIVLTLVGLANRSSASSPTDSHEQTAFPPPTIEIEKPPESGGFLFLYDKNDSYNNSSQ